MKASILNNLRAVCASVTAFALCTLGNGVITRRAKAFSVLTVTSTADNGTGSLRDTIANANSGDTIMFNLTPPAIIPLTTGEIAIAKTITIIGLGAGILKISGTSSSRIFNISATGNVTISDLDVADGAVSSASMVGDVTNTGGGIYNAGTLSATNCLFVSNQASVYGGAVENLKSAVFTGCSFSANSAGAGGAISNESSGTMSIANCTFASNSAGGGGAISNVGPLSINDCSFTNNSSKGEAGAIFNGGANLWVTGSTFNSNLGGTCSCPAGSAGAIENRSAATFTNCTFGANSAAADGGAIWNRYPFSVLNLTNCTLSGNSAASGGGIFSAGTLNLHNTIIAHSTGGDCVNQGPTGINSHNLIQDGSCSPLLSGDPMLGQLFPNGGPTETMALLAGSPAIDAGDNSVRGAPLFLIADQRGIPRCHVDIGAYEFAEPVVPPPTVICPPNISTVSDPGTSSAMVSFSATATDFCDGQITPAFKIGSTVITSPHVFPAGTTQVTAFATDLLHITGMCTFTVTVTALDICLQDDHTGDTFRFSSQTGTYVYTRCKDKFTLSGTGSVKVINHIVFLTDSRPDRNIIANFNQGQLTGNAKVTLIIGPGMYQPIMVFQTNPHPTCVCP
jgi:hypothetical protein